MPSPYLPTQNTRSVLFLDNDNSIADQSFNSIYGVNLNTLGDGYNSYRSYVFNPGAFNQINSSSYLGNGYNFNDGYNRMQFGMSADTEAALRSMYESNSKLLDAQTNRIMNPTFAETYIMPAAQAFGALSSLGNMYLGFQNLGLQKQQLGIAKEQWAMTKEEMARIAANRKAITEKYFA